MFVHAYTSTMRMQDKTVELNFEGTADTIQKRQRVTLFYNPAKPSGNDSA